MILAHGTLVAVADGEKFKLFRSSGQDTQSQLEAVGEPRVASSNHSGGSRHSSSAANPDEKQDAEDMHTVATAEWLNREALGNRFEHVVIVAPPKMLGELRKHYHKVLEAKIVKEISKDLTGQSVEAISKSLHSA